ncbi:MAG: Crp/Fnr family transcriptional regulator [Methyloceanibacter sp.]|uniref:Crp/Fnr family transcriptional regulator n=1 Tax=Methyloceanibacter sp. TaxID=1965321 RepID=UPI003D6D2A37
MPRRVLQHARLPIEYLYFIEEGLVSVLASAGKGNAVEVLLIGREGVVGIPGALGLGTTPLRHVVQVEGSAVRIRVDDVGRFMAEMPQLRALLLNDLHAAFLESSQSAACSLSHSFPQRLARWLLTAQDRCDRDELPVTHDLLARILGVRRATVSEAIKSFVGKGILARVRGVIRIRDRGGLENIACRCYRPTRLDDEKQQVGRRRLFALPALCCLLEVELLAQ